MTKDVARDLLSSPGLERVGEIIKEEHIGPLCEQKHSYALIDPYGEILACVGVIELWKDRGEAWAFFSPKAGAYFFGIHKIAKRFLSRGHFKRIEATVETNFVRGEKWVRMLGFKLEAPCLAQYREGQDYALYSFIS